MRRSREPADRVRDLVRRHLTPGMAALGFARGGPGYVARRRGVSWCVGVDFAAWSVPDRLAFTLAWGVEVHGLDDVLGERRPPGETPEPWDCPVHGRLGEERAGGGTRWFVLAERPWPLGRVRSFLDAVDRRTAAAMLEHTATGLVPRLARLGTVEAVQRHLVAGLADPGRPASADDLVRIRCVAALSLLQGEVANAGRWLDYLEARSVAVMAPDVVAERLAGLRRQCLVAVAN